MRGFIFNVPIELLANQYATDTVLSNDNGGDINNIAVRLEAIILNPHSNVLMAAVVQEIGLDPRYHLLCPNRLARFILFSGLGLDLPPHMSPGDTALAGFVSTNGYSYALQELSSETIESTFFPILHVNDNGTVMFRVFINALQDIVYERFFGIVRNLSSRNPRGRNPFASTFSSASVELTDNAETLSQTPYEVGMVVYRVLINGQIDMTRGAGKILRVIRTSGDGYHYEIDWIRGGNDRIPHKKILPTKDFFDNSLGKPECYYSNEGFGVLFDANTPFILKNGYLYNKNATVILKFVKFKTKFHQDDPIKVPSN